MDAPKPKRTIRVLLLVAALSALPVLFAGWSNEAGPVFTLNDACADNPCPMQVSSVCWNGTDSVYTHRERPE
jgi:hypothetical protein